MVSKPLSCGLQSSSFFSGFHPGSASLLGFPTARSTTISFESLPSKHLIKSLSTQIKILEADLRNTTNISPNGGLTCRPNILPVQPRTSCAFTRCQQSQWAFTRCPRTLTFSPHANAPSPLFLSHKLTCSACAIYRSADLIRPG
jgi:hypothetical protein